MTEQTGRSNTHSGHPSEVTAASHLEELRNRPSGLDAERAAPMLNPELGRLDTLSTGELVAAMNAQNVLVQGAVEAASEQIVLTVDAVTDRLSKGGRLIYVGAGTAGRLGVLDASECPVTFGTPPGLVVGVLAGGPDALRRPVEYADEHASAGARDLHDAGVTEWDAVVGISASGRTPYVIGALEEARKRGAFTAALACHRDTPVGRLADVAIEVVVGPEILAGSTRLKAGTAQKLVLNMISTLAMVRLGKTYGNLMVDLKAKNPKLLARARRTVQHATGVDADEAVRALDSVGGSVKAAILVILTGIQPEQANEALEKAGGFLRTAIEDTR